MRDIHTSTITDAIQDSFRGRFVPPTASSSWPRTGKHVVSFIGLAPAISASADKYRLGHISQQGSALLRWVLGQAAPLATRGDAALKRIYFAVLRRRGRPKAKVALARRLLIRLYVMLRDQIDYDEFCRRGRTRREGLELARTPV